MDKHLRETGMKKLNVIDLDGTLISDDSFRTLLLRHKSIPLYMAILLRTMRLIGRTKAAQLYMLSVKHIITDDLKMQQFSEEIVANIRVEMKNTIDSYTDENTVNLLLSPSPIQYVRHIAKSLGYLSAASDISVDPFFHWYGKNKLKYIEKYYLQSQFLRCSFHNSPKNNYRA